MGLGSLGLDSKASVVSDLAVPGEVVSNLLFLEVDLARAPPSPNNPFCFDSCSVRRSPPLGASACWAMTLYYGWLCVACVCVWAASRLASPWLASPPPWVRVEGLRPGMVSSAVLRTPVPNLGNNTYLRIFL